MTFKLLSLLFLFCFLQAFPCTVYKITKGGKTFVGNNEDYWDANTRIWFENGKTGDYGVMFVGQDNLIAQGGMNEKGLVFDGFSVQMRQLKLKTDRMRFYPTLFKDVMKKCANISEVQIMLNKYDLSPLNGGMLLYIEKSGKYLVVEADTMMMGNENNYLLSNFCPSQTSDVRDLNIPYFQKGRTKMEQGTDTSFSYLTQLSDTMHQDWGKSFGGTLYTTIYDLNEGTVNLYFYHDYKSTVRFNLKDELEKADRIVVVPELFPENVDGQFHYTKYNNAKEAIRSLASNNATYDSLALANFIETEELYPMLKVFEVELNDVGYELLEKGKVKAAINVFKLNVNYFPKSWNCYDSLADGYMKAKLYSLALLNYQRSVEMNPNNKHGIEQIRKLERQKRR
jgi:tetratricopeptide (TPR) repeat protein